jgi:hypothetical protein
MLQSSCSHNPTNQGKSSTHLLSSSHLSATQHCDECGQHAQTPQMSQLTIQSALSRISHLKEIPCLGMSERILLPTSTNNPLGSLSHRTIIRKSPRYTLPHTSPIPKVSEHHPSHLICVLPIRVDRKQFLVDFFVDSIHLLDHNCPTPLESIQTLAPLL